jgi:hypothetical protein
MPGLSEPFLAQIVDRRPARDDRPFAGFACWRGPAVSDRETRLVLANEKTLASHRRVDDAASGAPARPGAEGA